MTCTTTSLWIYTAQTKSVLDQNMAPRTFISNQMSVYISQIFCQKYFDKSKKEQVIRIAENLRDTFRERLKTTVGFQAQQRLRQLKSWIIWIYRWAIPTIGDVIWTMQT